jgi:hypothetical protein
MTATYEDAGLIMQIARWGTEMGLEAAMAVIWAEDFDAETASFSEEAIGKVAAFGEFVGTFVKHGILDEALVLDTWWLQGLWARVGPAAIRDRERMGEPRLFENFEAVATRS